jgi:lipopolysaccharide export system permease protein
VCGRLDAASARQATEHYSQVTRLGGYLFRRFASEAAALFGVALSIIYLAQTLRIVDPGTVRDRGFLTVLWQTVLALPSLAIAFLYLCLAVGLARALRAMQATRELHIIHVGQQVPALLRAILIYALSGMLLVMAMSHVITPMAKAASNAIEAQAAADLVGRSLVPNRFAVLTRGVTVTVGGRGANGEITSFFADDRRDELTRRTYIADSALITRDEQGYVLQLAYGTIQYRTFDGKFSEISFIRYDLALDRLTGAADDGGRGAQTTWELMAAQTDGDWSPQVRREIGERTADGLRVLGLCLFVAALSAFPSGRRREPLLPVEITVLGVVALERLVSGYLPIDAGMKQVTGVLLLIVTALVVLAWRLRVFAPVRRRVAA